MLFKLITKASFTVSLIVRIDFEVLITNIFFLNSCSSLLIFCCFRSLRFIIFEMHNCANKLLYCNYKVFIYRDRGLLKIVIFTFYIRRFREVSAEVSRSKVYSVLFKLITKASFTVSLIVRIDFEVLITNIFFLNSCSSLLIFCCFRSLRFIIFEMHNCANKLLYCNYKVFIYRDRGLLKIAIFTFYIRRIRDASSLQVSNPLFILICVQKA